MVADNPRGQQALNVSIAFTVLALVSVTLRLYTRWFIVRSPGIEDHLIVAASVGVFYSYSIWNGREETDLTSSCFPSD